MCGGGGSGSIIALLCLLKRNGFPCESEKHVFILLIALFSIRLIDIIIIPAAASDGS